MKKVVILILIVLKSNFCFSLCASEGIFVWPRTPIISTNSIFIIEGYRLSKDVILGLNKKHPIYLKSENSRIDLKVLKTLESEYNLSQAILKPISTLKVGEEYKLIIENLEGADKFEFERDSISWKVSNYTDTVNPCWIKEPIYQFYSKQDFGCGDDFHAVFDYQINDISKCFVYTKLNQLNENHTQEYYIFARDETILVGHSMCSGGFILKENENYAVQFGLIDASGNVSEKLTNPILFNTNSENDFSNHLKQMNNDIGNNSIKNEKEYIGVFIIILVFIVITIFFYFNYRL